MNKYQLATTAGLSLSLGLALTFFIATANAEKYTYNFTKEERQEYNLMALCYGTDILIDAMVFENTSLKAWCHERYGALERDYGEPINSKK